MNPAAIVGPSVESIATGVMGIHSSIQRGSGWNAGGTAGKSIGECDAFAGKPIHIGRVHMGIPQRGDSVAPLLISQDENDIADLAVHD